MICAGCGQSLGGRALFCRRCGRRVRTCGGDAPAAGSVKAEPPEPAAPQRRPRAVPAAIVVAGVLLAAGVYWSLAHEDAAVKQAGARRIAAATGGGAANERPAAHPAVFSAGQALLGLYGNYDPVVDGAYWTVTGAPRPWRDWNGKTVAIKPLVSRSDELATRHVLVTSSVEVEDGSAAKRGAGCRDCKSLLGAALYHRRGNAWQLLSEHRFLNVDGEWGAPPQVAVAFLDSGAVELRFSRTAGTPPDARGAGAVFLLNAGKATRVDTVRPDPPRPVPREKLAPEPAEIAPGQ